MIDDVLGRFSFCPLLALLPNGGVVPMMPAGSVVMYAGTSVPDGWLRCDGSSLSRITYATLFSAIGQSFGSVDGSHFTLPDFRGFFPLGVGAIGGTGVAQAIAASNAAQQGPAHVHSMVTVDPLTPGTDEGFLFDSGLSANGPHDSGSAGATVGSAAAQPPFLAVYFLIKT